MRRLLIALLTLASLCQGQAASDNQVVVGNPAQPVQWAHAPSIQQAILQAGPTGAVWIPATYAGNDCNPLSSCSPGTTLIVDLRGGTFATFPALNGGGTITPAGDLSGNSASQTVIGLRGLLLPALATTSGYFFDNNGVLTLLSPNGVQVQSAGFTPTLSQTGAFFPITCSSACTVLLSNPVPASIWSAVVQNASLVPVTVDPNGLPLTVGTTTITTGSPLVLLPNQQIYLSTNGSNYFGSVPAVQMAAPGAIGGTTPNTAAFTTLSATGQFTSTQATGSMPLVVTSKTPVTNLTVEAVAAEIGPITGTNAPKCIVDGVLNANIQACITKLTNLGFATSGTIESYVPEDFTTNIFALNNFRGVVHLHHRLGAANTNTCSTSAPFTCWLTEVPLVLPTHLRIEGDQNASRTQGDYNSSTVISFGTSFPAALGAPSAPTLSCGTVSGGTLSNGTYSVKLAEALNKLGLANNANSNSTPGYGAATASLPVTCAAGGSGQGITFTAPAALGTGQFIGQDLIVYSGATAGSELENVRGATLATTGGCSTAGAVDPNGCNLAGGTITILALGSAFTTCVVGSNQCGFGPPIVDQSNCLFNLGSGVPGIVANAFGVRLETLTLAGSPANSTTPAANEPSCAVTNTSAQEQSGVRDITVTGPFALNYLYFGLKSGNSTVQGVHFPSNDGPNTGTFIPFIDDGNGAANGGARKVIDVTFAARCSGCSSQPTVPEMALFSGNAVGAEFDGHIENDVGGDGILVTNLASLNVKNVTGFADTGKALVHISATADKVCGFVTKDGKTNASVQDDGNSRTGNPGVSIGDFYCNSLAIGSLAVAAGLTMSGTSGAQTTISTTATNANLFLAPNGTGAVIYPNGSVTAPSLGSVGSTTTGWFWNGGSFNFMCFATGGATNGCADSVGYRLASTGCIRGSNGTVTGTLDTGLCRGVGAAIWAMGNGTAGDKTARLDLRRVSYDGGTTLVAGDFVLSASWGSTASIAMTLASSKDGAAVVTITSTGTGQAISPTIAYTFHDGSWSNTPACSLLQTGGNDVFGNSTVTSRSATAYTWQWNATPTATKTYEFTIHCIGS